MNQEIHRLLKSRRVAFKLEDLNLYKKSRYDLCNAIRDAKRQYQTKLEAQTNQMDMCRQWLGLHDIKGYKMEQNKIADKNTSLPDVLNSFYAQVEQNASGAVLPAPTAPVAPLPSVTAADVRSAFSRVNPRKETGPDRVPGPTLRSCADQLAGVFTYISNLSLLQPEVPTYFKKTSIIPAPKKTYATCLNDYCSMAVAIIMKSFERLVMAYCLEPMQFAYRCNRSTVDVISLAQHSSLEQLDNKDTHVRLLFIECSSAFNTIIPTRLISKLREPGLSSALCNWILSFLTHRSQLVK
eukprot:g38067.t1